ncbi:MAG: helix-turn-helix transcriptional regulator [Lactobacillaceae bacterium]|jgi:DNA-binding HxlR family transcriptional regulator|nr:helix-turn-helix transcriptional regulator [Lactobacillaceae bacterium]
MVDENLFFKDNIILDLIGTRWKLIIINRLMHGTKRFGELKKDIGDITQKVLTENLKALEEYGLLIREAYAQIPPRVEYSLTTLGESLKPIIDSALEWGNEYKNKVIEQISELHSK